MRKKKEESMNGQRTAVGFKKGFVSCICMGMLLLLICIADMQDTKCYGTVVSASQERIVNDNHYYVQVDIGGDVKTIEVARLKYNVGDEIELRYSVVFRKYSIK